MHPGASGRVGIVADEREAPCALWNVRPRQRRRSVSAAARILLRNRLTVSKRRALELHGEPDYFLAGSPLGTPMSRQRFLFSSQVFSARLRAAAAAAARASSGSGAAGAGAFSSVVFS